MHNLHLVVVKADSAEDACSIVETELESFGNENNWRTICGAVSEKDEVFSKEGDFRGRYTPSDCETLTIEAINKMVKEWMKGNYYGDTAKKKLAKGKLDFSKWNSGDLWSLEQYAKHLYQVAKIKESKKHNKKAGKKVSKDFDVLNDSFYAYEYTECGVTHIDYEGEKTYVVFVDMHS